MLGQTYTKGWVKSQTNNCFTWIVDIRHVRNFVIHFLYICDMFCVCFVYLYSFILVGRGFDIDKTVLYYVWGYLKA